MFRKTLLISALCASSIGLTGCSTLWSMASEFSADMSEVTKFSFLRGSSTKDDISFAENTVDPVTGVYKTDVGEYTPAEVYNEVYTETATDAGVVDTSPHPCPDGTYLTEEGTCMSLDVDTYDFSDLDAALTEQVVDTSQHDCPEDTYLNDKNQCMFFETETFDFQDDVSFTEQIVDTSPHPCPEDTYLTAEGACMVLNNELVDLALNTDEVTTTASLPAAQVMSAVAVTPAVSNTPAIAFAANLSVECPEGFTPSANNSCMFLGAELQK